MSAWTWGGVHRTKPEHPLSALFPDVAEMLNPPGFPVSGDGDTPQAGSYASLQGEGGTGYTVTGTSVARYVWDTSDWDNSRWIVPLGASGHPGSAHYADQGAVWADVRLIPATYSWDKLEREAESVQRLEPAPAPIQDPTQDEVDDGGEQDATEATAAPIQDANTQNLTQDQADDGGEQGATEDEDEIIEGEDAISQDANTQNLTQVEADEGEDATEAEDAPIQDDVTQDMPTDEADEGGDAAALVQDANTQNLTQDEADDGGEQDATETEDAPIQDDAAQNLTQDEGDDGGEQDATETTAALVQDAVTEDMTQDEGEPAVYEGSRAGYGVIVRRDVMIEMRDGALLATDLYFPALMGAPAPGRFPVILERTPYDKATARQTTKGRFFARRGYVTAIQDVRGRFASEGEWYPFAEEAEDGFDTVEWLGVQEWSDGKVGTMGDSYAGSDQAALATLDPPHLATMIVAVGASNYFSSSMRQNGALEQRFLIYAYRMAVDSPEAMADPSLRAALQNIFENGMSEVAENFPIREGASILRRIPKVEQWVMDLQTRGEYSDYWKQRGYAPVEYYEQHADVPTLYLGGWYDSYARNTTESYMALSRLKQSPQRLLMGPWTHGQYEVTHSGDIDFGLDSHIDYNDLKLAWLDHHLKGLRTEAADWGPVRIFTMGGGDGRIGGEHRLNHGGAWRQAEDWPLPGTRFVPHYFHADGSLSRQRPKDGEPEFTAYLFDPSDPVPTIGGGISAANPIMEPGAYDQRGDPSRFYGSADHQPLNARADVLTFETPELGADVEVTGPITVRLWVSSSALDTDFTAKLIDVYPPRAEYPEGLAINITDSIIRARYRNGFERAELMEAGEVYALEFELYPTSNVFAAGHRIRVDVSSSNWPRFDVNHNTGEALGMDRTYEVALQTVHHCEEWPSQIVLPVLGE